MCEQIEADSPAEDFTALKSPENMIHVHAIQAARWFRMQTYSYDTYMFTCTIGDGLVLC